MLPQLTTGFARALSGIHTKYSASGGIRHATPANHSHGSASTRGWRRIAMSSTAGAWTATTGWLASPSPTTSAEATSHQVWLGSIYQRIAKYVASAETSAPSAYTRGMPDWLHNDALNAHVSATAAATGQANPSASIVKHTSATDALEQTAENTLSRSAGEPAGTSTLNSLPSSTYSGYPGGCGMPITCTAAASSPLSPT